MEYTKDWNLFEPFISAYLLYSVKAGFKYFIEVNQLNFSCSQQIIIT